MVANKYPNNRDFTSVFTNKGLPFSPILAHEMKDLARNV